VVYREVSRKGGGKMNKLGQMEFPFNEGRAVTDKYIETNLFNYPTFTVDAGYARSNTEPVRQSVDFRFESLNWDFIMLMAKIASYAGEKYGTPEQYTKGRLEGEKSPVNHMVAHIRQYVRGDLHDYFGTREAQLAAIAYNAMMEYYYFLHGGSTAPGVFYE
jgi:hypothetical protein